MDEAEKYKQRLEAIAEKRRLQEEQDRVRREMEDEKLRLQQLKRKSLRDQWLMEGAPLSPTGPQSPHSPPSGTQPGVLEKHIGMLQSEHQEKLEEVMEVGQKQEAVNEAGEEMVLEVMLNGEETSVSAAESKDEEKVSPSTAMDETTALLTNGGGMHGNISHCAVEPNGQPSTNGFMQVDPVLGFDEEESAQAINVSIIEEEEEEEEEIVVMRAECVIITEEGDDIEVQTFDVHKEESVKVTDSLDIEAAEKVMKTETDPVTFLELDKSTATELVTEAQLVWRSEIGDKDKSLNVHEEPALEPLQAPANALEGVTVALIPIYSEAPYSSFTPKPEAEMEVSPAHAGLKGEDRAFVPGQFQEVPLSDGQVNQRTEAGPGEEEPLLSNVKAPNTSTEPAGAQSPAGKETQSHDEGGSKDPKRKACQCCSVM